MYEELVKRLREEASEWRVNCCYRCGDNVCGASDDCKKDCDIVSKLQAADAIEELLPFKKHVEKEMGLFDKANELLNALKPRWIPVTERLPGYGDWVLGIGPKHGYHICEYRGIIHFPYSGDSPWFSAKGRSLNITHWMPLPEPPKEET